ncbi:MAG: putative sulfate exporter family transporter [Thermodesulfovibrionales bacterium]|nr:putative sulfate exporter family transporter [Thermodesulfovibrionales bacterium]
MMGILLSFVIGLISLWISSIHPSLDSLVLSIIIGMLVGNFVEKKSSLQTGINVCIKYFLPAGIILYGTQLVLHQENISHMLAVPVIFILTFMFTFFIGRLLGINKAFSLLLSSGLAVCGTVTITIISPLVGTKKEETSLSIISVMVVGLIGLIVYPLLNVVSGMSNDGFALFTGTTLPMLGQVKVVGNITGEAILNKAIHYKTLRVSLLMILILWFGLISKDKREESIISFPRFLRIILVAGFFTMVITVNTLAPGLKKLFEPLSIFFLTVTLSAIGLSVDFDSIADIGPKPLYAVFISWVLISLLVHIYCLYYV